MEQLITAFGIDLRLIMLQIVNFGLLAAGLTYLLYKPVLQLLHDRKEKIEQGLKDADAAAAMKAGAEKERQEVLSAAHGEAEAIAARAKKHADEKTQTIVTAAEEKAEQLIKNANAAGVEIKHKAQKESEADIAKAAVLAAEKILSQRT